MLSELTNRVASLFRRSSSELMTVDANIETAELSWNQKLFKELIKMAQFQIGDIDRQQAELLQKNTVGTLLGCRIVLTRSSDPSPGEADAVRASIVEALALAGDLAAAEKVAESISIEGHDEAVSARQSIIEGWARKDPKHALKLALNIRTVKSDGEDEYVDEDEREEECEDAMFAVLKTVAEKAKPDEVRKLAVKIIPRLADNSQLRNHIRVLLVRAMAAVGGINEARKMAAEEEVPRNQIPECLSVYEFSRASEDIEAARTIAEEYNFKPYEQWLKIAEVTHELQDIARARAEIMAIPVKDIAKGWTADFERNFNFLTLAKISGDPNDVMVVREALVANPETADSLFMELCRITRDRNDFALLLNNAKRDDDRYSALACIAGITGQEADFIAASKEALSIVPSIPQASAGYLCGRSLAELAQVLCGKPLRR